MTSTLSLVLLYCAPVLAAYLVMTIATQDRFARMIVTTIAALVSLGAILFPRATSLAVGIANAYPIGTFYFLEGMFLAFLAGLAVFMVVFVILLHDTELKAPYLGLKLSLLFVVAFTIALTATAQDRHATIACIERSGSLQDCLS